MRYDLGEKKKRATALRPGYFLRSLTQIQDGLNKLNKVFILVQITK